MLKCCAVTLAACFSLCAAAAASPAPVAGENDYRLLVGVGSPVVSPDGKRVAVVIARTVWNDDRSERNLVEINVSTRKSRVLVSGRKGVSDPVFSPDGTRVAFLADPADGDEAHTQVFVVPPAGGVAHQITHAGNDVDQFAWRPDSAAIVYAAADAQPHRSGAARFEDSFIFTTEPITAHSAPSPDHLFVQNARGGLPVQLTFGSESCADPSWAPDGRAIAFTSYRNAIDNDSAYSHIALVDVATKNVRALTGRTMWESTPVFSPDGTKIAYAYTDGDPQIAVTHEWVTTPGGGIGSNVSGGIDRPIGDATWSRDSKSLILTAPDGTTNSFYRLVPGSAPQRIDVGNLTAGTPLTTTGGSGTPPLRHAIANDGTLVFNATWTAQPQEVFARFPGGRVARLSGFNDAMSRFTWGGAQRITFATSTGVTADGVLYTPPGFSPARKYPLVLFVHGGPGDPTMMEFDFWAQVMAARGWLVLRPNYRGSPNLGYTYQHAIFNDPDDGPGKDLMAALDTIRARGIVDDSRLAVSGWSYGGIMTSWMISKYHIWKAAVSGASVNDWITDYGTADDSMADRDLFRDSPFAGDNAQWRQASAISYVADVTTPVLILSDVGDNRDPFATSAMYWRALRDNHKDATLRAWPIAGHFPDDPVRVVDVYHYWIAYIAEHFR